MEGNGHFIAYWWYLDRMGEASKTRGCCTGNWLLQIARFAAFLCFSRKACFFSLCAALTVSISCQRSSTIDFSSCTLELGDGSNISGVCAHDTARSLWKGSEDEGAEASARRVAESVPMSRSNLGAPGTLQMITE